MNEDIEIYGDAYEELLQEEIASMTSLSEKSFSVFNQPTNNKE